MYSGNDDGIESSSQGSDVDRARDGDYIYEDSSGEYKLLNVI
jgi:hypothetical protein